ncbi:MAG: AMP-binding protein [Phycisphaera sp.]|nr:AMP-binding protein [Phycisphaera sp.]
MTAVSDTTVNIASHLPAMAARQPDTIALRVPIGRDADGLRYAEWTYAELDRASDEIARGLQRMGVTRGTRTALLVPPSAEFFALVFALFKVGAVMVCVDPGIGVKNMGKCLTEAEPEAFIGVPKAQVARRLLGWARGYVKMSITVGGLLGTTLNKVRFLGQSTCETSVLADTQPDDLAAILFTSGSTGIPKGVVYTHGNFDAQVRALVDHFDIQPGEVDLCTFPLFALYAPAMGMTAVIPRMDFTRPGSVDPREIIEPVRRFGVTNMFGSPALLRRVIDTPDVEVVPPPVLPSLKRVISAGAPVPATVIKQWTERMLGADADVHTPYGATESLPVACIAGCEILGETSAQTDEGRGVCVGRPVGDVAVRVIRITDEAIDTWADDLCVDDGQIGEIVVRGPAVTASYHHRPDQTRLAKIADTDAHGGGVWHRMGDLGYLDESGRVWFCGRKIQRVKLPDGDLYTIPCEAVFNTHPAVRRTALVGVQRNGVVQAALCFELRTDTSANPVEIHRDLKRFAERTADTRRIEHFLYHSGQFPVDIRHNAKIGREKLAKWAAKQLGGKPA